MSIPPDLSRSYPSKYPQNKAKKPGKKEIEQKTSDKFFEREPIALKDHHLTKSFPRKSAKKLEPIPPERINRDTPRSLNPANNKLPENSTDRQEIADFHGLLEVELSTEKGQFVQEMIQKHLDPSQQHFITEIMQHEDAHLPLHGVVNDIKKVLAKWDACENAGELKALKELISTYFRSLNTVTMRQKITHTLVEKSVKASRAAKQAKQFAHTNPMRKEMNSRNTVTTIHQKDQAAEAYFKQQSPLEPIMWKVATLMGYEDLFVGTKQTQVFTRGKAISGSVQYAQEGKLFFDVVGDPEEGTPPDYSLTQPSRKDIIGITVKSHILGSFDLHSDNLIVDKDGKFHLFDNTCNFPNHNGFLNRGQIVIPSYRSVILCLPENYVPLTDVEKLEIIDELKASQKKADELEAFFNSEYGVAMLSKLPPGWLDPQAAIAAMRERIAKGISGLQNGTVKTLSDLVITTNREIKLAMILTLAIKLGSTSRKDLQEMMNGNTASINKFQESAYPYLGVYSLRDSLKNCANFGFNIVELGAWSYSTKSMESIIQELSKKLVQDRDALRANTPKANSQVASLYEGYKNRSVMDLKDRSPVDINKDAINVALNALKNQTIPIVPLFDIDLSDKAEKTSVINGGYVAHVDNELKFWQKLDDKGNFRTLAIDYTIVPGKFVIRYLDAAMSPMKANELKHLCASGTLPKQQADELKLFEKFEESTISPVLCSSIEARNLVRMSKKPLIYQVKGSYPAKFRTYLIDDKGLIKRYDLDFSQEGKCVFLQNKKRISECDLKELASKLNS